MSLAGRLRMRRKHDLWIKGSSVVLALAIMWLIAVFVIPFVVATAPLPNSRPAKFTSTFDSSTLCVLLIGIGLCLPRLRRTVSGLSANWLKQARDVLLRGRLDSADQVGRERPLAEC